MRRGTRLAVLFVGLGLTGAARPVLAQVDVLERPAHVDLVVVTGDTAVGFSALWLSSRPFVHAREISGSLDEGVWVAAAGGDHEVAWPFLGADEGFAGARGPGAREGGARGPTKKNDARVPYERLRGAARTSTTLWNWLRGRPTPEGSLAAVVHPGAAAVYLGPACTPCEAEVREQVGRHIAVLSRGLSKTATHAALVRVDEPLGSPVEKMLALAADPSFAWPGRVPIQSVYLLGLSRGHAREELFVSRDARGQAHLRLAELHRLHRGEVEVVFQLARARRAWAEGSTELAARALDLAIVAAREALAGDDRDPLWHAHLALALAMRSPKDDAALAALREAQGRGPRVPEVHMIAAEVHWRRGEFEQARGELASAYRLRPGSPVLARAIDQAGGALPGAQMLGQGPHEGATTPSERATEVVVEPRGDEGRSQDPRRGANESR